jgi:hypothetical protein
VSLFIEIGLLLAAYAFGRMEQFARDVRSIKKLIKTGK